MSLILEALKKLEREKQAPDRGFLVVAHVPWPAGPTARSLWLVAGLALGLIGLVALLLLRGREHASDDRQGSARGPDAPRHSPRASAFAPRFVRATPAGARVPGAFPGSSAERRGPKGRSPPRPRVATLGAWPRADDDTAACAVITFACRRG